MKSCKGRNIPEPAWTLPSMSSAFRVSFSRAFLSQLPQTCNPIRPWSDVVPFCFRGTVTTQIHAKQMKLFKAGLEEQSMPKSHVRHNHAQQRQASACFLLIRTNPKTPHRQQHEPIYGTPSADVISRFPVPCETKKRNLFDLLLLDSHTPPPPSMSMLL